MPSLGIMGGTFNPIHIGHLIAAQEALASFSLDKVFFVPNKIPPHRLGEPEIISSEDRYEMVSLAVACHPKFYPSRIELDRSEVSFTLDTIRKYHELFPDAEISFISGLDSLIDYHWHGLDEMLGILKRFVAVTRPGFRREDLKERVETLHLAHDDRVQILEIPDVHISSTLIRKRLRENIPVTYLVPSAVEAFIKKKQLYRG